MQLYPALKSRMGSWDYYIVKMRMRDIVKEVGFASEVYNNKTLDDAIQRTLSEGRVKNEIVSYLARREDRFFSSIVVAALGGSPKFYPVEITDDPHFAVFKDQGLDSSYGVLTFDGGQRYFALDGQHRLKAIKTLIDQEEPNLPDVPEGFVDEEVSVIMLVRQEADDATFFRSYRRLFSSLNRYAKPTDADTNIIMDEDDAFAITTRRLLTEHRFFGWSGKVDESPRLKTKGKNLSSDEPYFTTLQTLYGMNASLLWGPSRDHLKIKDYKQHRPSEEELDSLYEELVIYWDAILDELEFLSNDPTTMRVHDTSAHDADGMADNLLFWPIGQELFAKVVRTFLTRRLPDPENPSPDNVRSAIRSLASIDWNLHKPPWRGLLIIQSLESDKWRMRSEDRKVAVNVAEKILRWKVGLDDLLEDEKDELKSEWHELLICPPYSEDEIEALWS